MNAASSHNLILLQHELLMSLGATTAPEETFKNFSLQAIESVNLKCVFLIEKDNPILGLEAGMHQIPEEAPSFNQYPELKKFDNCGFPDRSDFVAVIFSPKY